MELISWEDKFSVGIIEIDFQHKVFIVIINQLQKLVSSRRSIGNIQKVLNSLSKYVDEHFSYEEELFKKYSFPDIEEHIKEHNSFKQYLIKLEQNIKNNEDSDNVELLNYLQKWFVNHILESDKEYGSYFKDNNIIL